MFQRIFFYLNADISNSRNIIIYALMNDYTPEDTVNFGVAASAVKHTIHGDGNITDDVSLIRHVMEINFDIKR